MSSSLEAPKAAGRETTWTEIREERPGRRKPGRKRIESSSMPASSPPPTTSERNALSAMTAHRDPAGRRRFWACGRKGLRTAPVVCRDDHGGTVAPSWPRLGRFCSLISRDFVQLVPVLGQEEWQGVRETLVRRSSIPARSSTRPFRKRRSGRPDVRGSPLPRRRNLEPSSNPVDIGERLDKHVWTSRASAHRRRGHGRRRVRTPRTRTMMEGSI
jgi:hypothetical protein